ncbi:hypothetical protein D0895_24265 (plasmid) [Serratia ureilytica]|uniref:hypothetical protein n=1 Tax=Serratia ureilytica TaxID=300181 RepID=UPI00164E805F|nr:hypothetical protein [Serratia ureilytica]QNL02982.1 hypothetical protein D0895_24265 [Serratia ureilytica]
MTTMTLKRYIFRLRDIEVAKIKNTKDFHRVSRGLVKKKLENYGFVECSQLNLFLDYFCDDYPGYAELAYIYYKLAECIDAHDNGDAYFNNLNELSSEIKNVIYSRLHF